MALTRRLPYSVLETQELILSCDPAVVDAWTAEERAALLWHGECPPGKGVPLDATRIIIRPLGWGERRALQGQVSDVIGLSSPRGEELSKQEIKAIQVGPAEHRKWQAGLTEADRTALYKANLANARVREAWIERGFVRAQTLDQRYDTWDEFATAIPADALLASVMIELYIAIQRLSGMGVEAKKS